MLGVERGAGLIDFDQYVLQVEMIALRRQAAIDRAGADGDENFAVVAKLAQHVNVLGVADAALDDSDVAGSAMLDVGERRAVELDEFDEFEQALVDVEKRGVAAKTAGERCRRDAQFGYGGHLLASSSARSSSLIGAAS